VIKDINDLENIWASQILDYEYLIELVLTYDEYENYCRLLYREKLVFLQSDSFFLRSPFPYKTVLVVLAVNCAYFEYDEKGFWIHFLSRLGLAGRNDLQETIGYIIEDYLFKHQFLSEKREGPFRYVGAILEQCGVTKRYLPRFAEFLKTGANKYSWSGLITISKSAYEKLLPEERMPKYLHNFLADTAGWKFTINVARSIVQASEHPPPIEFFASLKGFRRSFFSELWELLKTFIPKVTPAPRISIPLPKFVYQPRLNRLAILFDDSNVRLGNYRLDNKRVFHSPVELESRDDFKEVYSIDIKVKEKNFGWRPTELKGWSPEKKPYAFFDAENGELLHTQKYLSETDYYLIISTEYLDGLTDKYKEQIEKIIKADFGWLSLPFGMFRGIGIAVEPVTDLSFLGIDVDNKEQRHLVWADNAKRLIGAEDLFNVFVERIPDLVVKQPELFYSNQRILMGNFGGGPKQIKIPADSNRIELDCAVPSKGEIWVEPLGRCREFSEGAANQRLSFCCVPDCKIIWPDRLMGMDEEPVIEIQGDKNVSISFDEECVSIDDNNRRWKIPKRRTFVEGTLTAEGNIFIRLARLIHRASLRDKHRFFLYSLTLKEFFDREGPILTGYPDEQAKLFIRECGKDRLLANLGRFDKTGELPFNTSALRDTLGRRQFVAGQLCVEHYGKTVLTETRILNAQEIINRLITLNDDFGWSDALVPDQKKALEELRKGIDQKLVRSSLSVCDCLQHELLDWGKEILYCAWFFDGTKLEGLGQSPFAQNDHRAKAFKWLKKARAVSNAEKEGSDVSSNKLLADLKAIAWRPPIKRWKDEFENICKKLKADSELTELLLEWKNEVVGKNYFVEYKSRIGQMVAGKELTNAWKYYRDNKFDNKAYKKAKRAIAKASSPVSDLALILINILLLKNNAPEQVEDNIEKCHRKLLPYIERSILRCKKASGKTFTITTGMADGVDINLLPIKHEDEQLFLR
jgi:hypothetical protein